MWPLKKFMASSTSNDERKKMLKVPPEAKSAYCNHAPFDRISTRVRHEVSLQV